MYSICVACMVGIYMMSPMTEENSKILLGSLKSYLYQRMMMRLHLVDCDYILKCIALHFYRFINNVLLG